MSQISLSDEQRVEALRPFGYTEREAAFLSQAALHGGYFLRRQFCRFLGKENGGTVAALIEKVLRFEHAEVATYAKNTHVYHLNTRPFYTLLGQPDNRNRRPRQPFTVKNKLMGFDFVLEHSGGRFLATEQAKVDYFIGLAGVPRLHLPMKLYRSRATREATVRYFVDKYPIFLSGTSPVAPPVVSFCFVDEGTTTPSHFETWLGQYSRLFASLAQFRVVHVAAMRVSVPSAAQSFQRFLERSAAAGESPRDPSIQRLIDHFVALQQYESKQFDSFDRARLLRLRTDREELSGEKFETLYKRWKVEGDRALLQGVAPNSGAKMRLNGTFSTHVLEHDYDIF
jgi:hypothetical protein